MKKNKEPVYRFCLSDREMDLWNANLPQNISSCIVCAARVMACLFIVGNCEANK
jgi:hypothetical protein